MVIRALTKTSPVSISGEGQPVPRRTGVEATSEVVPKSVCRAEAGGCRDLFDQHIDSFQQTPRLMNASLDLFAGRCAGSGSQLTRRWREQDSNLYGAFCVKWLFWFFVGSLFGAGRPFFVPSPAIRFPQRAEGVKGPKR